MKISRLLLAIPLMFSSPLAGQTVSDPIDAPFAEWASRTTPGCVVGAMQEGRELFVRAYGMADLEHDVPNTPQTVFEAGSVSKQFTAAAILLLVQDGRLALSDDVHKYLPELPDYGVKITIDHLLTHTSGLRDWGGVASLAGLGRHSRIFREADVLDIVQRQRALNYSPGMYMSYTNTGYTLLATIVERVSGSSLPEFTRERMFKPLGMTSTSWRDDFQRVVPGRAVGYRRTAAGFEEAMPFENTIGYAGLLTTVGDLLRWNEALRTHRLGPQVTAGLQRKTVLNTGRAVRYGRGLFVDRYKGLEELSHGGTTAGYNAWLGRYPGLGLSVALLCNAPVNDVRLAHRVVDQIVPGTPEPLATNEAEPPAVNLTPDQVEELAGIYISDVTGLPEIFTASGNTITSGGEAGRPISPKRVRFRWRDLILETPDRIATIETNGERRTYWRADGPLPTQAQLAELAGHYYSHDTAAIYEVRVEEGRLTLRIVGHPAFVLRPTTVGPDVFRTETTLLRVHRGRGGKVNALSLSANRVRELLLEPFTLPAAGRVTTSNQ